MNLFQLETVHFQYGEHTVLEIPHLVIEEGGIVCLTGANGSGKTTLLNLLAGLMQPSGGRILYRGMDLSRTPADLKDRIRREMGVCLQSPYLFRTTVEGNVTFGLTARGIKGRERFERVEEALRDVGLDGFAKRRYHALSGGEVQRVALARALAIKPRVLLLDEPMANVDAASRTLLERILEKLASSRGITIVFVTHDVDQALRLGRQVITLHEGHIVDSGLENIFHGTVREKEGRLVFDTGLTSFTVLHPRKDARTAIVPSEAILLSLDPKSTSARNVLTGKICGIRMRNGSVEVIVDTGEEFVSRITEESLKNLGLHLGMEIHFLIKAGAIKLY
jgi:molybdopterin-binding protein